MNAECELCAGTPGLIKHNVPVSHPDFGKFFPCPNEEAHREERVSRLHLISGLKEHEWKYTTNDIVLLNDDVSELLELTEEFIANPLGWLYIWGGPGNAKSLVLMCLVNAFIEKGRPAIYITLADLLDVMRETFKRPEDAAKEERDNAWRTWTTYQSRFDRVQNVDLLAIDEFDSSKINETSFAKEFRARLVDHRYRDAIGGNTVTVLAGNEDPSRLPIWIHDRIQDGRFKIYHNEAPSARRFMDW